MPHPSPYSDLPHAWVHVQLAGIRAAGPHVTYEGSSCEDLPPIPIELDDACQWLIRHGTEHEEALDKYERDLQPSNVEKLAAERNLELPQSFRRFMTSPQLQRRVRSCTACYLDPGERVVDTTGTMAGHLIHFLSDQQSCMHWYLHLAEDGQAAVLTSPYLYCYYIDDPEWPGYPTIALEKIDLRELEFSYCASSFSEFLYRFWIENEIWYAIEYDNRPLKPLELQYVNHYKIGKAQ
jgi:hypothetical protein